MRDLPVWCRQAAAFAATIMPARAKNEPITPKNVVRLASRGMVGILFTDPQATILVS